MKENVNRIDMNTPAESWLESFPVGTGRLAGMVSHRPDFDICYLNHELLWETLANRKESPHFAPYLPELRRLLRERRNNEAVEFVVDHCPSVNVPENHDIDSFIPAGEFSICFGTPEENGTFHQLIRGNSPKKKQQMI